MNKNTNQADDTITRVFNDASAVTEAIQAGVNDALLRHKQLGKPICVWRDDQVMWIAPEDIQTN